MALLHIAGFVAFASVVLILTQDVQIFPGVLFSLFSSARRDLRSLPQGVESVFIKTKDGKSLELWRLPAAEDVPKRPFVGLAFHGNAGTVDDFFLMQLWFQELGMTSYGFDYRGFGKSSGWPSEKGICSDGDAVWDYITGREKIDADKIIVCGFSVGSAPAARIAALHQPKLLVLVSAFTSIKDVIRSKLLFRFLAPFCWWRLSTIDYVRELRSTALVLLHGTRDNIVPAKHAEQLEKAYCGSGGVERIMLEGLDHNMVFYSGMKQLGEAALRVIEPA